MTKGMKPGYRNLVVPLPADLIDHLDEVADERVVGRPLLVAKALEFYLAHLPPLEPVTPARPLTVDPLDS